MSVQHRTIVTQEVSQISSFSIKCSDGGNCWTCDRRTDFKRHLAAVAERPDGIWSVHVFEQAPKDISIYEKHFNKYTTALGYIHTMGMQLVPFDCFRAQVHLFADNQIYMEFNTISRFDN